MKLNPEGFDLIPVFNNRHDVSKLWPCVEKTLIFMFTIGQTSVEVCFSGGDLCYFHMEQTIFQL